MSFVYIVAINSPHNFHQTNPGVSWQCAQRVNRCSLHFLSHKEPATDY